MKLVISRKSEISFSTISPHLIETISKHERVVYITIDPNTESKHSVKRVVKGKNVTIKVAYKFMTHEEQYNYLNEYISEVYIKLMEHTDWIYWIYELTESGNMHIHGLLYSKSIQDDYDLQALRKTAYSHPYTIYNMSRKGAKRIDYMNEIVYWNQDIEHIKKYFTKDMDIKNKFPDEYIEK